MTDQRAKIRLYVGADLSAGAHVRLDAGQSHYLTRVMRLTAGASVGLFNGRDGEWLADIAEASKSRCVLVVEMQIASQFEGAGPWLAFSPLKKEPTGFLIEKAVELGVDRLMPILTRFTTTNRVNVGRLRANAVEAAEQCGRLSVPTIDDPQPLDTFMRAWPPGRMIYLLDETGIGAPIARVLDNREVIAAPAPAFVCGPEGGFAPDELDAMAKLPFVTRVGLGPRILRAETAALSALACWQVLRGDGQQIPATNAARR